MANLLNIGFDGTFASSLVDLPYQGVELEGIINHLGRNYGTSGTYTNAHVGGQITVTATNMTASAYSPSDMVNHTAVDSGGFYYTFTTSPLYFTVEFTDVVVQPSRVRMFFDWGSNSSAYDMLPTDLELYGSTDGSTYIKLDDGNSAEVESETVAAWADWTAESNLTDELNTQTRFWKYIRIQHAGPAAAWSTTGVYFKEFEIYGKLYRLDGGNAGGSQTPVFDLDSVSNANLSGKQDGDYLSWQQGGLYPLRPRFLISTRQSMTGTVTVNSNHDTNFYILNPNGADRNVDLPTSPIAGVYYRIRNLNNTFELNIRESGPTTIATIGGAGGAGLTQAEVWWDGTEWQVITY